MDFVGLSGHYFFQQSDHAAPRPARGQLIVWGPVIMSVIGSEGKMFFVSGIGRGAIGVIRLTLLTTVVVILRAIFIVPLPNKLALYLILIPVIIKTILCNPITNTNLNTIFKALIAFVIVANHVNLLPARV